MKFTICYSKRIIFRDIYFLLLSTSLIFSLPIKTKFSSIIVFGLLFVLLSYYYSCVFFENSYLYLTNKKKISPINDSHIKIEDVIGYSINNPFPIFNRWCKSSKNLTLYLSNGKQKILSVKEQSILIDWLTQNNINYRFISSWKNIFCHIVCTILNLISIVIYLYKINTKYTDLHFGLFLISILCCIYWIFYCISGLYIKSRGTE